LNPYQNFDDARWVMVSEGQTDIVRQLIRLGLTDSSEDDNVAIEHAARLGYTDMV
jgi:ankyrin repeat protein